MPCRNPFPLPDRLDKNLQPVLYLWRGLVRAENRMPFADDLDLSVLSNISRKSLEFLGEELPGVPAEGNFLDEVTLNASFSYLRAQCSATVEATEPTFLHLTEASGRTFSRLLLPMWGNGQINMLVGAADG